MKTITIYELLGLIKDGKAPKKIKHDEDIYVWNSTSKIYIDTQSRPLCCVYFNRLNDTIAILEEENKDFEDKSGFQYSQIPEWSSLKETIKICNENFERHQKAIYKIIERLNSDE